MVTVLHVSDMQFGAKHRFGDRLAVRLLDDLSHLKAGYDVAPDLLIVSGDLAEQAKPSEFELVYGFLTELSDGLGLGRERVVVVPGNHDVSWAKCRGYFDGCEGDEIAPLMPYWPKLEPFAAMFRRFYGDTPGISFPPDQPWTVFEVPELKTVVVGLNSVMAESHEVHHGWCGEEQLRSVAKALRRREEEGWLRLGVMHHNPVLTGADDTAALQDAAMFEALVAPSLHLLLHGHTHEGKICSTGPDGLPVLCAGSAGVRQDARADDIPNQYQLVRISAEEFSVFARRYNPAGFRWEGDTSVGRGPEEWQRSVRRSWEKADAVFPPADGKIHWTDHATDVPWRGPDELLARVRRVCEVLRRARAEVVEVPGEPPLRYLRVTEPGEARVRLYPVGAVPGTLDQSDIDAFRDLVDRRYRAGDSALTSYLVYEGEPVSGELRQWAALRGISIQSLIEFQGYYDLRPYADRQAGQLEGSQIYPSSLYVPQRYTVLSGPRRDGGGPQPDVLGRLQELVAEHDGRFIVVLGDFGHGKTFLLRELTRRVHEQQMPPVIPILIQLRELEKAHSLEQLLAAHLTAGGEEVIDHVRLKYLISEGRVLLLFDGFDELALRVTYDRAAEHLDTLVRAAEGRAKVVLTSRTQYFLSDRQVETALSSRISGMPGRVLLRLESFTDEQIVEFLTNLLDGNEAGARHRFELIRDIRDLLDLSRNPRMLSFIAALDRDRLIAVRDKDPAGSISAAALYRELLHQWLVFEYDRSQPTGALPTLTEPERWDAVSALALRLWGSGADSLALDDLEAVAGHALQNLADRQLTPDQASHLIGSGTLLVRTSDGCFKFVHRSVMEWLVADSTRKLLKDADDGGALSVQPVSELMADFLTDLAGRAVVVEWSHRMLRADSGKVGAIAKRNALTMLLRLHESLQDPGGAVLQLGGLELRALDLSDSDLRGANLAGADLSETRLDRADLSGASLRDASLARCSGNGLLLRNADLREADLSRARLLGADLGAAALGDATFTGTCLIGAVVDKANVSISRAFGTALPGASISRVQIASPTSVDSVAWHPGGEFIATCGDRVVRVWDAVSGDLVRELGGAGGPVWSVAWSPDGGQLAAAGSGVVRVWDAVSGDLVRELDCAGGPVLSVAWSPDGGQLAAAGSGVVRVWDAVSGDLVRELDCAGGPVLSVAWSPDGGQLAAGGDSGVVRVWDAVSGDLVRELGSAGGLVLSVAWSPDGGQLAAAGYGVVRVWDAVSGDLVRELDCAGGPVWSVAWSPDGGQLAAAGYGVVRVWDAVSGDLVRELDCAGGPVWSVAWSPDGGQLAAAGSGVVRVWDAVSGDLVRELDCAGGPVLSVAWSPDGGQLAAGGDSGVVRVWDAVSGDLVRELGSGGGLVWSVAWSPDGGQLAAGGDSGVVRVWDAVSGDLVRELDCAGGPVLSVAWSPDGGQLAAAGSGVVRVWDAVSGDLVRELDCAGGPVLSVAWSPDGGQLAAGGDSGVVRVWDAVSGDLVRELGSGGGLVWSVAWSPDGGQLAAGGGHGVVRVWDAVSGDLVRELGSGGGLVWSVAWSPDGGQLAAGGGHGVVRVWDAVSGDLVRDLVSSGGSIRAVSWSPDGTRLACGHSGAVSIWNATDGVLLGLLIPLSDGWAVIGGDGFTYKYAGTVNGEFWWAVNLCPLPPGELDPYYPQLRRVPVGTPLVELAPEV